MRRTKSAILSLVACYAGAFQCSFCTSGFIMMTKKLLEENPHPTEEEIRQYLVGNLCRCSAYPEIIDAVKALSRPAGQAKAADQVPQKVLVTRSSGVAGSMKSANSG